MVVSRECDSMRGELLLIKTLSLVLFQIQTEPGSVELAMVWTNRACGADHAGWYLHQRC